MLPVITASRIIQFLARCYSPEHKLSPGLVGVGGRWAFQHLRSALCSVHRGKGCFGEGLAGLKGHDLQGTLSFESSLFEQHKTTKPSVNSIKEVSRSGL